MEKAHKEMVLRVKERLGSALPGQESHFKMLPPERRTLMKPLPGSPAPVAGSVLIVLFPMDDYFGTLLIRRTEDNGVHSRQISFPGGKSDEQDAAPVHTALREAEEEIGLNTAKIEVIGMLSPLFISPSNFEITPVVAIGERPEQLNPNPAEVEYIIELPLKNLENLRETADISVRGYTLRQVPCFNFAGQIIWGATAMVLQELVDVLVERDEVE